MNSASAVETMREEAAKVADAETGLMPGGNMDYGPNVGPRIARAIRALPLPPAAPSPVAEPGWQVVPIEPTREMSESGRAALREGGLLPAYTDKGHDGQRPILDVLIAEKLWPAMLAAAPASPSPADTGGKRDIVGEHERYLIALERITAFYDDGADTPLNAVIRTAKAALANPDPPMRDVDGDHLPRSGGADNG